MATFREFLCLRFCSVLARFGLGFRWCLAVSGRPPTRFIFVFVPARLRDGCSPATAAIFLSLEGSVGNVSAVFVPAVS